MRNFSSTRGDIYIGNVVSQVDDIVIMDNYSVWYKDANEPFEPTSADDSVEFKVECELPI
jgi:hypothetical protein